MKKENIKKVVLAYSGGLDTSIIIPWLKENYNNCEVIAVSGNVGQADELEGLEEKALKTGASKLYVLDLTDEYVDDYIIPTMKAGAVYEEYLLGTSHARPCIAKGLVEIALQEGQGDAALQRRKMGNARHVRSLLHTSGGKLGEARLAAGHNVGVVSENAHGVGAHGAGGHMQNHGQSLARHAVKHGYHQHKALA